MNRARVITLCSLASCMLVVGVVRTLPRRLEGARVPATEQVRAEIAADLGTGADAAGVDRWIGEHPEQYEQKVDARTATLKADLAFTADDGHEHAYLADYDSYFWLQQARNYLRNGTVCDETVEGVCRDRQAHAPVGREMLYANSLHTAAIVVLHKLIHPLAPGFPLSSTAFFVPVIVGMLGVIPAFFLGRRFGGLAGGVTAALVSGLSPALLIRTIGSDNDIWNVVLPLYVGWAGVEAFAADNDRRRFVCAIAAGIAVSVHAVAWSGWAVSYAIVLLGGLATLAVAATRSCIQRRGFSGWRDPTVRAIGAVLLVFVGVTALAVAVVNPSTGFLQVNIEMLSDSLGRFLPDTRRPYDAERDLWPEGFSAVAELLNLRRDNISLFTQNVPLLFGAFWGIALLGLGRRPWSRTHWAVLGLAFVFLGYASVDTSLGALAAGSLLFAPALLAVALALTQRRQDDDLERGALVLIVWLAIAYIFGTRANRFVMFFAPPVGIAAGILAGWLYRLVGNTLEARAGHSLAVAAGVVAVAAVLATPVYRGYVKARDFVPQMNDAWWQTFTTIRDTAPANAVINLWWHDGHWAKYIAERPVIADGASLRSHIPFWFTRALLADDEARTVGLLRMLDCGSDALPYPEGASGAYSKLRAAGLSTIAAQALVEELADKSRADAEQLLLRRGVSAAAVPGILEATHCVPPPMYVVLGEGLATTAGWGKGLWDFRRAYLAEHARHLPRDEALRQLTEELGYSAVEARRLYRAAQSLRGQAAIDRFIAPDLGFLTKTWVQCTTVGAAAPYVCPLASTVGGGKQVVDAFEYSRAVPGAGRLRIRHTDADARATYSYRTPGTIFVAGRSSFRRMTVPAATDPALAVLIDIPGNRILMAEPQLLASTFTKLMFLDGRYLEAFRQVNAIDAASGERVVTYRVSS